MPSKSSRRLNYHKRKTRINKRKTRLHSVKGGAKWKSGADTCVFNPVVQCKDNAIPKNILNNISSYISRVVPKSSYDVQVEYFIKKTYPYLIEKNLISVAEHFCTPRFSYSNLQSTNFKTSSPPCSDITAKNEDSYENMITKLYITSVEEVLKTSKQNVYWIVQGAINAAVALVPDTGPWVIHTDCHFQNIGTIVYKEHRTSILADWGRCIIIKNPNDPTSVLEGLMQFESTLKQKGFSSLIQFRDSIEKGGDIWKQHPLFILDKIILYKKQLEIMIKNKTKVPENLSYLRGWAAYVILTQIVYKTISGNQLSLLIEKCKKILECKSQAELIDTINTLAEYDKYVNIDLIKKSNNMIKKSNNMIKKSKNMNEMQIEEDVIPGTGAFKPQQGGPPPMEYTQGAQGIIPGADVFGPQQGYPVPTKIQGIIPGADVFGPQQGYPVPTKIQGIIPGAGLFGPQQAGPLTIQQQEVNKRTEEKNKRLEPILQQKSLLEQQYMAKKQVLYNELKKQNDQLVDNITEEKREYKTRLNQEKRNIQTEYRNTWDREYRQQIQQGIYENKIRAANYNYDNKKQKLINDYKFMLSQLNEAFLKEYNKLKQQYNAIRKEYDAILYVPD